MADGVIETSSGDLLRAGGTYPDSDFDATLETIRNDVPEPYYRRGQRRQEAVFHRWNGSSWDLVPAGSPYGGPEAASHKIETITNNRVTQVDYYFDEVNSASGYSGFSGLMATEYYVYSGNKYYGYSEVTYDTLGNPWAKLWHGVSTTGSTQIYRNLKKG